MSWIFRRASFSRATIFTSRTCRRRTAGSTRSCRYSKRLIPACLWTADDSRINEERRMDIRKFALSVGTLAVSHLSFSAETAGAAAKDVSKKAGEAGRALKDYTVAQRDEALKQAKAALDDADARIRRMER